MLFKYFSLALLASATQAIPVADVEQSEDDLVLFKRDSVLSARDLELADIHGVNMTESKPVSSISFWSTCTTMLTMAIAKSVQALHV